MDVCLMAAKDVDWELIKQLYEDPSVPVARTAKRAGLTAQKLSALARKSGWVLRSARKDGASGVAQPLSGKPRRPGELVKRVYATIDGELSKLEAQKGLSSQDRERASRALAQMVNSLEKAIDMQREMTKRQAKAGAGTGGSTKDREALAHAEDIRRQIAERLDRLGRQRRSKRTE